MVHDLDTPTPSEITRSGIVSIETPVNIMLAMAELAAKYNISVYDAALMLYAKESGSILLSGDKLFRAASKKEGVTVKGTLWVLEELVTKKIIQANKACFILERMFMLGRRLPPEESSSKIIQWEK